MDDGKWHVLELVKTGTDKPRGSTHCLELRIGTMTGQFNTNYSDFEYGVWLRSLSYEWRTLSGMATRVELSMQFLTGTCMHAMLVFRYMGPLPQCSMGYRPCKGAS